MSEPIGRTPTPRATALWRSRCYADPRFFVPSDTLSAEVQQVLEAQLAQMDGLPCCEDLQATPGQLGIWCGDCRLGEVTELYTT